jgi:uncharacterized membrane protein
LAACALLVLRLVLTKTGWHAYLFWNLCLAWLPLLFALIVWQQHQRGEALPKRLVACFAWLLFFPNAPYLCTDLVHLGPTWQRMFWADLVLILLFAQTGLVLGFLSLFLMQKLVARRWGWPAGWCFAVAVSALAGFGIFLGRFRRWNSWDVLLNPFSFLGDMVLWLVTFLHRPTSVILPALFAMLVLLAYVMFYALTGLPMGTASFVRESTHDQA